jgi:hypothetical protein
MAQGQSSSVISLKNYTFIKHQLYHFVNNIKSAPCFRGNMKFSIYFISSLDQPSSCMQKTHAKTLGQHKTKRNIMKNDDKQFLFFFCCILIFRLPNPSLVEPLCCAQIMFDKQSHARKLLSHQFFYVKCVCAKLILNSVTGNK